MLHIDRYQNAHIDRSLHQLVIFIEWANHIVLIVTVGVRVMHTQEDKTHFNNNVKKILLTLLTVYSPSHFNWTESHRIFCMSSSFDFVDNFCSTYTKTDWQLHKMTQLYICLENIYFPRGFYCYRAFLFPLSFLLFFTLPLIAFLRHCIPLFSYSQTHKALWQCYSLIELKGIVYYQSFRSRHRILCISLNKYASILEIWHYYDDFPFTPHFFLLHCTAHFECNLCVSFKRITRFYDKHQYFVFEETVPYTGVAHRSTRTWRFVFI